MQQVRCLEQQRVAITLICTPGTAFVTWAVRVQLWVMESVGVAERAEDSVVAEMKFVAVVVWGMETEWEMGTETERVPFVGLVGRQ